MRAQEACPQEAVLELLLLGRLGEAEAGPLEGHLASCDRCAARAEAMQAEDGLVAAMREGSPLLTGADAPAVETLVERARRRLAAALPDLSLAEGPGAGVALAPAEEPGEVGRLGAYRVLKVLGSGGLGVVYLARHGRLKRLVALKVIEVGPWVTPARLARFRREAELVARVRHPNVVELYEAGEWQPGEAGPAVPFFAMEHVEGGNLAERLAAGPLAPGVAAAWLEGMARGVQAAHEQGVVHRDLKPANVLLAAEAGEEVPRISDFGLAKRLSPEPGEGPPEQQTQSGAIVGTPSYMAPEQAAGGKEVGPAADVYALGAILYEMLTARPPFKAASLLETLEQVRTREPVPPGGLQPGLPRDLETICLKCLRKEPAHRYQSALELADDLRRYLSGEPIRARPVGPLERAWKWARRSPALAALLGVSGLSALGLACGVAFHNAQLRRALERAEDNEAEARRQQDVALDRYCNASDTLKRMLARLQGRGRADLSTRRQLRRALLEDSLGFYHQVLERAGDPDPAIRLDVALACQQTGTIQEELGLPGPAKENLLRAVALLEGLPDEYQQRPDVQDCLVACYTRLGRAAGTDRNELERWQQKALAIRERLAREKPDDPGRQSELARAEHNLAVVYQQGWREPGRAEPHYARAIALRTRLMRDHPRVPGYPAALAGDYQNLGLVYAQTGRKALAGPAYEKAAALLRPLVREHPDVPDYTLALSAACLNWGNLLREAGKAQAAVAILDEGVELAEAEMRHEPGDIDVRDTCLNACGARAQAYERLGLYADAARDYGRVAELAQQPRRSLSRLTQAVMLVRGGDHSGAAAVAGVLAEVATSDDTRYNAACVYALAGGTARSDRWLGSPQREALAEGYAGQALALLRRLAAAGYFKTPERAALLGKDTDFDALRARPDFKELLAEAKTGKR
jgi:serine/threonine protein kinase